MLVNIARLLESLKSLKDDGYKMLIAIVCRDVSEDKENTFELTYVLYSFKLKHKMYVKTFASSVAPSISKIFKSASFEECEIYDLFGIYFENHPDIRRILMGSDWVGHPLRKNYVNNDERLLWRK